MAKSTKDYSKYKVEEVLGTISKHSAGEWGKYVLKCSYDDAPSTVDIRNMKNVGQENQVIAKGISLSPVEADTLTDVLVSKGYGNTGTLEQELIKRKKQYGFNPEGEDDGE